MRLKKPHERRGAENHNSRIKEANVEKHNTFTSIRKRTWIMKERIKKSLKAYFAFILITIMLIGMLPIHALAYDDECYGEKHSEECCVDVKDTDKPVDNYKEIINDEAGKYAIPYTQYSGVAAIETINPYMQADGLLTVIFFVNGVTIDDLTQYVSEGGNVYDPGPYGRDNLNFAGWFEKESTTLFAFGTPITGITESQTLPLVARYTADVAFNLGEGVEDIVRTVPEGTLISTIIPTQEEIPQRAGFNFAGWRLGANVLDSTSTITADGHLLVTAQFTRVPVQGGVQDELAGLKRAVNHDEVTLFGENQETHNHLRICDNCKNHTFRTKNIAGVWFTEYGEFKFLEMLCPLCGATLLFQTKLNPTPKLDEYGNAIAPTIQLGGAELYRKWQLHTVQFTTNSERGELTHNVVISRAEGTNWDESWEPGVTARGNWVHTKWIDQDENMWPIGGPFPPTLTQDWAFEAVYDYDESLSLPAITIRPSSVTRVFNGAPQTSDAFVAFDELGRPIVGYNVNASVLGSAINVGDLGTLTIDPNSVSIFDGNNEVTEKFRITLGQARLNIIPAQMTIIVSNAEKYQDELDPEFEWEVIGQLYNDYKKDLDVRIIRTNADVDTPNAVGETYEGVLVAEFNNNPNYNITVIPGNFTILPVFTVIYMLGDEGNNFVDEHTVRGHGQLTPDFRGNTVGYSDWYFRDWAPEVAEFVTENVIYRALWGELFTITYEPGDHGTFKPDVHEGIRFDEDTPNFRGYVDGKVPGAPGWIFNGWLRQLDLGPYEEKVYGHVIYVAQWIPNTDTPYQLLYVTVDGQELSRETRTGTTGATVEILARTFAGYTFDATADGNVLIGNIEGDGSLVLVRVYTVDPATPIDPTPPTMPEIPTLLPIVPTPPTSTAPEFETTIATPPSAPVTATPADVETPDDLIEIPDEETPLAAPPADDAQEESDEDEVASIIIDDPDVPLALIGETGAWALWNLILSIAGVVLAIMVGVHLLIRKRNDEKDDTEECDVDEEKRRSRVLFVLAIPILAIIGIILFILTQDMRLPMIMIDWWTLAHAILFVVAIISYLLAFRTEKRNNDNDKAIRELA